MKVVSVKKFPIGWYTEDKRNNIKCVINVKKFPTYTILEFEDNSFFKLGASQKVRAYDLSCEACNQTIKKINYEYI